MNNLNLIRQPNWRVAPVVHLARIMGVLIHVEGIPFGSGRPRCALGETRVGSETLDAAKSEALRAEIAQSWQTLENSGFPPEACGWPERDITGCLPEAIECALDCLIRQRNELLREVRALRKEAPLTADKRPEDK